MTKLLVLVKQNFPLQVLHFKNLSMGHFPNKKKIYTLGKWDSLVSKLVQVISFQKS